MQVKTQMSRKVVTIPPATTILRAMEVMRENSIRHLPVVDGEDIVGLVTEGDLRQASLLSMVDKVSIDDVMIKKPFTISPDATIEEAARLVFMGYFHILHGAPGSVFRPFSVRRHFHQLGIELAEDGHQVLLSRHHLVNVLVNHWYLVQSGRDQGHALLAQEGVHFLPLECLVRLRAAHDPTGTMGS